jgi:hypothetical protein
MKSEKTPDKQLSPKAIERLTHLKNEEHGPKQKPLTPFQLRMQRARVTRPLVTQHRLFEQKGRVLCTCRVVLGDMTDLREAKWNLLMHRRAIRQSLEQGI